MFNDVIPLNIKVAGQASFLSYKHNEFDLETFADDRLNVYVDHAFNHYKQVLLDNPEIWSWFSQRKIQLTEELIERYCLGFADRTLCKGYKRSEGRRAEIVRGAWQVLGLIKPSGHQYFLGDAVFPVFDATGCIVGAYGRRVTPEKRPEHVYHHHWFNGDATFFNRQALFDYESVIICKSQVEALTFITAGIPNVVSIMGIYSFGSHHLAELEHVRSSNVILALDNTDTGNHVSGLIAQVLNAQGVECQRLPLPRNMDINRFAQDHEDHITALHALVDAAFPYQQTYENLVRK